MSFVARPGRIDLRLPIVLALDGVPITAETRNIGLGGVFVATQTPAPVGRPVSLKLTLPGLAEPLLARGEVRWIRESEDRQGVPGVGIKFVKLPLYVAAALDNLVRSHAPIR